MSTSQEETQQKPDQEPPKTPSGQVDTGRNGSPGYGQPDVSGTEPEPPKKAD